MSLAETAAAEAPAFVPPPEIRQADERLILLTPSAGKKTTQLIERDGAGPCLRVSVSGGGCNGLSYRMRFDKEPRRGDLLVMSQNTPVLVDVKSALYVKGSILDYSHDLVGGGFKFSNPNAKASCSCGESFSV